LQTSFGAISVRAHSSIDQSIAKKGVQKWIATSQNIQIESFKAEKISRR
jgi:hypothetical protein